MEKIVVLRNLAEENTILVQCLRMVFPECEIEIRSKREKTTNTSEFKKVFQGMNEGSKRFLNSGS